MIIFDIFYFQVHAHIFNEDTGITVMDQRFNICQISKIKGLVTELVAFFKERINFEIECPFKKGNYVLKSGGYPSKKRLKAISPAFALGKFDPTFNDTMTVMTRTRNGFVELGLIESNYKLSNFY